MDSVPVAAIRAAMVVYMTLEEELFVDPKSIEQQERLFKVVTAAGKGAFTEAELRVAYVEISCHPEGCFDRYKFAINRAFENPDRFS